METCYARPPAMVYPMPQHLGSIYEARQALRNGTLYPELFKPMLEKNMPIDGPAATDKQAAEFAAWELRLYLNTHPDDQRALDLYRRFCAAIGGANYPCSFVADGQGCQLNRWTWLDDPWPWEYQGCAQTEVTGNVCV